jgi:hypothetical protein
MAGDAVAKGWPEQVMHAARHLAHELEDVAGLLDTANDRSAARAAFARAQATLPLAFEIFGRAVADNLTAGSRAYRPSPRLAHKD